MDVICALDIAISLTIEGYKERKNISMDDVADMLNINRAVFRNKACATNAEHKFRSDQLVDIQRLTKDNTISRVMLEISSQSPQVSETSILTMLINTGADSGDVMKVVHQAVADGVVTQSELKQSISVISKSIENFRRLEKTLLVMADKGKMLG